MAYDMTVILRLTASEAGAKVQSITVAPSIRVLAVKPNAEAPQTSSLAVPGRAARLPVRARVDSVRAWRGGRP